MKAFLPKIETKMICKICGGGKQNFKHDRSISLFEHNYQSRLETPEEAAYRIGYEDGYREAEAKALWGTGWD